MIVLDASVMIAYLNPDDAHHLDVLDILDAQASSTLVTSVVTLSETLVFPARSGTLDRELASLTGLGVEARELGADAGATLAHLRADHGLKTPDAIVLHTARSTGSSLATFDERLAKAARDEGVETFGA